MDEKDKMIAGMRTVIATLQQQRNVAQDMAADAAAQATGIQNDLLAKIAQLEAHCVEQFNEIQALKEELERPVSAAEPAPAAETKAGAEKATHAKPKVAA